MLHPRRTLVRRPYSFDSGCMLMIPSPSRCFRPVLHLYSTLAVLKRHLQQDTRLTDAETLFGVENECNGYACCIITVSEGTWSEQRKNSVGKVGQVK